MRKINVIYVSVLFMVLASCAVRKSSSGDAAALVGQKWQLVELNGNAVQEKVNGKMPFLELDKANGRYSASGGCNGIGGEYTLEKNNGIKFSRGISTMMACPDMTIENGLRTLFEGADTYTIDENALILSKKEEGTVLARFKVAAE